MDQRSLIAEIDVDQLTGKVGFRGRARHGVF